MVDDNKKTNFESFLEGVFEECNRFRIERNIASWYDLLIVATINLSTEMTEEQLNSFILVKDSLADRVNSVASEFGESDFVIVPIDIEKALFMWEISLRKIRRDAGLQHNVMKDNRRFT